MTDLHLLRDAPRGFGDDLETASYRMESARIAGETREIIAFDKAANQLDIVWTRTSRPLSERIDCISRRARTHEGLQAIAIHHVNWSLKQARDAFPYVYVVEHGDAEVRIELDHYVDVAIAALLIAGNEPNKAACATPHALRAASWACSTVMTSLLFMRAI